VPLIDSLAALVSAAPPDATVPVRWIGELLAAEVDILAQSATSVDSDVLDLSVSELASRLKKGESTVRTWLSRGELPGAYKSHGHEWRIPLSAIAAMQREQAKRHRSTTPRPRPTRHIPDVGEWRKHLGAKLDA
jgi:excisionase family DNA binding protein